MKTTEKICVFPPVNLTDNLKEKWTETPLPSLLSLETHATVTQCSRLSTSAGPSGRTCWLTRPSRRRRRTCSHAWLTSSTPLPHRRRKWASSRPRSSFPAYGKRTVRAHTWHGKGLRLLKQEAARGQQLLIILWVVHQMNSKSGFDEIFLFIRTTEKSVHLDFEWKTKRGQMFWAKHSTEQQHYGKVNSRSWKLKTCMMYNIIIKTFLYSTFPKQSYKLLYRKTRNKKCAR